MEAKWNVQRRRNDTSINLLLSYNPSNMKDEQLYPTRKLMIKVPFICYFAFSQVPSLQWWSAYMVRTQVQTTLGNIKWKQSWLVINPKNHHDTKLNCVVIIVPMIIWVKRPEGMLLIAVVLKFIPYLFKWPNYQAISRGI
jgi:hypothetical protein